MNTRKWILLTVLFVALIITNGCKKGSKLWSPTPPYPGLEIPLSKYTINANKDTVLMLPNGTSISIPAGAMVTAEGQLVTGSYELQYREFHDAIDIMLAGIPMEINSVGEKRVLRTAGMFEMNALQIGANIRIAENKVIDVRFASKYPGSDYNFFYMNPESGSWEWADLPKTELNQEKVDALQALIAKAPTIMLGDKFFVISYDRFLDLYLNDDYEKIYKFRNDKSLRKKLEAYDFKIYDVSVDGEVKFLRSFYHPGEMLWKEIDGKSFPTWIKDFEADWKKDSKGIWYVANYSFLSLGNNVYQVSFTSKNKSFTKKMEAVMPLTSILKLSADQWQQRYDEAMQKLKVEQERIDLMAETYRSFSINRLGTYNFDCLLKGLEEWTKIDAGYTVDGLPEKDGKVMILLGDKSGYITISPNEYHSMHINPKSGHRIIMLMNDQKMGIFPQIKLNSINIDSLKESSNPSYTFSLESKKVNDAVALREMLGFK